MAEAFFPPFAQPLLATHWPPPGARFVERDGELCCNTERFSMFRDGFRFISLPFLTVINGKIFLFALEFLMGCTVTGYPSLWFLPPFVAGLERRAGEEP